MISSAINEVDRTVLAEMDGLKALRIKNGLFHGLDIKVILVPLQVHHHHQPVVSVITGMECAFDVCHPDVCFIGVSFRIVGDVLDQIFGVIYLVKEYLSKVEIL